MRIKSTKKKKKTVCRNKLESCCALKMYIFISCRELLQILFQEIILIIIGHVAMQENNRVVAGCHFRHHSYSPEDYSPAVLLFYSYCLDFVSIDCGFLPLALLDTPMAEEACAASFAIGCSFSGIDRFCTSKLKKHSWKKILNNM